MAAEVLRAEGLRKNFRSGFRLKVEELLLEAGRLYAILGPNGAGKTVLLKILSLLEAPDGGRIYFDGQHMDCGSVKLEVRRQITLVMQEPYLFRTTVFDNVAFGLRARGQKRKELAGKVEKVLSAVGLSGFGPRRAHELSGGEQKRVAIARALVLEPRILFLDEPTANVDETSVSIVEGLLTELQQSNGTTVVFSTHDRQQAYRLADQVYMLVEGSICPVQSNNEGEDV